MLGDEHNLSVLRGALAGDDDSAALVEKLRTRQNDLRAKALQAGATLYTTPPRDFVALVKRWWDRPAAARPRRKTA
jgi:hypothetical protein